MQLSLPSILLPVFGLLIVAWLVARKMDLLQQTKLFCMQSSYAQIVVQSGTTLDKRPVRILQTSPSGAQSAVYCDNPNELASHYTPFYDLAFHYNSAAQNILMLGGGAYCVPRHLLATRPHVHIDVVELDPEITQVAREYFFLEDHPKLTIHHEEARAFLNEKSALAGEKPSYDAIFGDVFDTHYAIPRPMTTVECFTHINALLKPGGIFIMNVIGSLDGEQRDVFHGVYAGIKNVFSRVNIFLASEPHDRRLVQNILLVAFKTKNDTTLPTPSETIKRLLTHQITEPFYTSAAPFTDVLDTHSRQHNLI